MPRIARIVGVGYPHHIIQRGNNRQQIFFDNTDKQFYLDLLQKYSQECGCKINAFCLMDNHVHILAIPNKKDSLAKTMQKLSLRYTQYINKKYNRTGRLWECRFHSCLVDKDEYLWSVCRYIESNPLRSKLVSKVDDYKWSSAKTNVSLKGGFSFVEPIWKSYVDRDEYIKFLNKQDDEQEIERIRKATYSGKPLGKKIFLEEISEKLSVVISNRDRGRPTKKINGMCP
ncbi:MAG: transposase [Candidatus Omnitrophota bacterium]|nr:transposase [Candidatus Omnitrophota bacterium]